MFKLLKIHELLAEGVRKGVIPGAVAGIAYQGDACILSAGYASLTPFLEPIEEDFLFDLASLTKPLALGLILMDLLDRGINIDLEKPLGFYLDVKKPLSEIPLFRFLNHTSGLRAWFPFYKEAALTLKKIFSLIQEMPLEYNPGERCVYSDLNFYLLTYFMEKLFQKSFERLFEEAKSRIILRRKGILCFKPLEKGIDVEKITSTSIEPKSKKILRGVVEDENTRALGGISGAAGLFGNIYGVLSLLQTWLNSYKGVEQTFNSEILKLFFDFKCPLLSFL